MADIDVVPTTNDNRPPMRAGSGRPGRLAGHHRSPWVWLLPLLLIAIAAAWFVNRDRFNGVRDRILTSNASESGTIRDLGAVTTAAANRRVELDDVSVGPVVGDRTFWVTNASGDRALVMIQERGREQQLQIREGQRLSVQGTVVRAAATSVTDSGDRQAVHQSQTVIQADRVSESGR